MKAHFTARTLVSLVALFSIATGNAFANHKEGHSSEGVGQIDTTQYACNGLGATECMLMKLDRIERRLGCPLADYLDDTCPYSPADTTATFCISQGREGAVGVDWAINPYIDVELGVGWPNVLWAKADGHAEAPIPLSPISPLFTELGIGGTASHGRNFDICIEVPLEAFNEAVGPEGISDEQVIDNIVRQINFQRNHNPDDPGKSKFQRRLGRLANYAIFRVPGTTRRETPLSAQSQMSVLALDTGDDGESEFDTIDEAIENFMSGNWQMPSNGGPVAFLKSPMVDDFRKVLEVPAPVQQAIDDPDLIIGAVFDTGFMQGNATMSASDSSTPDTAAMCDAFGLNAELRSRFAGVAEYCSQFERLPTFDQTTGIFGIVDWIRARVQALPTLGAIRSEIRDLGCDIAGWTCDD